MIFGDIAIAIAEKSGLPPPTDFQGHLISSPISLAFNHHVRLGSQYRQIYAQTNFQIVMF
jgi:hypothetical protein